jgi:hypothetical protein
LPGLTEAFLDLQTTDGAVSVGKVKAYSTAIVTRKGHISGSITAEGAVPYSTCAIAQSVISCILAHLDTQSSHRSQPDTSAPAINCSVQAAHQRLPLTCAQQRLRTSAGTRQSFLLTGINIFSEGGDIALKRCAGQLGMVRSGGGDVNIDVLQLAAGQVTSGGAPVSIGQVTRYSAGRDEHSTTTVKV